MTLACGQSKKHGLCLGRAVANTCLIQYGGTVVSLGRCPQQPPAVTWTGTD
jgi:hypothetical protein